MGALLPQPFSAPPRRRTVLVFTFAAVFYLTVWSIFNHRHTIITLQSALVPIRRPHLKVKPTNSTLGFGAILAISKQDSPRRHRLLQASHVTGLKVTIPFLPKVTEKEINELRTPDTKANRGSLLAWIGHHNALKWFLDSGLETALILEDDVDWDIHLRSSQVPLVAATLRGLLNSTSDESGYFWGNPAHWDLLYLGHCGDYFGPVEGEQIQEHSPTDLTTVDHGLLPDPSLPSFGDLHPFTAQLLYEFGIAERMRIVHRSRFPLCTFGYAITRYAAERLLYDLTPVKEKSLSTTAYDVAILGSCMGGQHLPSPPQPNSSAVPKETSGLRCWTVNPELFHHAPGQSIIADIENSQGLPVGTPPVDRIGFEQIIRRNETVNIGCGFWGDGFAYDDGDTNTLARLREEVGIKGHCIKTKFGNVDSILNGFHQEDTHDTFD